MKDAETPTLEMDREDVAIILARCSVGLFVAFSAIVLSSALPLRLLEPQWQLKTINVLINNSSVAIVALVFTWLATILFPGNGPLRQQRDRVAALAVAAALGYLLLIPLQGFAVWRGVQTTSLKQERQERRTMRKINDIRQALQQASSTADLQERLKAVQAPLLPPAALGQPLASIRPQIESDLNRSEGVLRRRFTPPSATDLWPLLKESVRVVISSLAFSMVFACGARWPGQDSTLLDLWLDSVSRMRWSLTRGKGKANRPQGVEDIDYIEQISGDES